MKKWLYLAAGLAALGLLSRLPHPARDIAKLDPVQAVYLYMDEGVLHMQTDTGDHGSGRTLTEAARDMKANADKTIFLDTAEFLILQPDVMVTPELYTLLRPACCVVFTDRIPDLPAAVQYLAAHRPELTIAKLRTRQNGPERSAQNAEYFRGSYD